MRSAKEIKAMIKALISGDIKTDGDRGHDAVRAEALLWVLKNKEEKSNENNKR